MKNKIVGSLIVVTGLLFTGALLTDILNLGGLGVITGLSAVATRFLIKENK